MDGSSLFPKSYMDELAGDILVPAEATDRSIDYKSRASALCECNHVAHTVTLYGLFYKLRDPRLRISDQTATDCRSYSGGA